jgi:hypothetical protein
MYPASVGSTGGRVGCVPATVVVVAPSAGVVVVDPPATVVVDAGEVVVVVELAVLGRRDGPPAAVVVGASLPLTAAGVLAGVVVALVSDVATVPVGVVSVVVG